MHYIYLTLSIDKGTLYSAPPFNRKPHGIPRCSLVTKTCIVPKLSKIILYEIQKMNLTQNLLFYLKTKIKNSKNKIKFSIINIL